MYIFDPQYESDLDYTCEGLGQWRGQPAWQIRFVQRAGVPSRIRTWRNSRGLFPVAMKGRVWVSANSYDVLHIETDLREPQKQVELNRDHLVLDYGPVQFEHGKTSLWLPWYAEMFYGIARQALAPSAHADQLRAIFGGHHKLDRRP